MSHLGGRKLILSFILTGPLHRKGEGWRGGGGRWGRAVAHREDRG